MFHYLKGLHYASRPDYMTVRHLLAAILNRMKSAMTHQISQRDLIMQQSLNHLKK